MASLIESPAPQESPNKRPRPRFRGMHKIINSTKKELTKKITKSVRKTEKWRKKLVKEKPKIDDDLMKVKVICSNKGIVFKEAEALEHMKKVNPTLKKYLDYKKKEITFKQQKQALVDIGDPNVFLTLPQCKKIIEKVTFGDKWGTTSDIESSDDEDIWRDGRKSKKKRTKRRTKRRKRRTKRRKRRTKRRKMKSRRN
jgi:hypothetical protein